MSLYDITNQTAIVTGGASGIGLATAHILAEAGARVIIADIDASEGEARCEDLRHRKGAEALFVKTDVSEPDDVSRLIEVAESTFGSLEILMHFAGVGVERLALDTTPDEWSRIIRINLTGTFLILQAAGRVMVKANYGRIIAMASAAALRGGTGRSAYGASKGGVISMVQTMAVEWASHGVTVNTLAPGAIDTPLVQKMHDAETRRAYLSRIPMNRYGTPDEVAATALFLALPTASYITGTVVPVDGGFASGGVRKLPNVI